MNNSRVSANIVLALTIDPLNVSGLGYGFDKSRVKDKYGIEPRIKKATEFLTNQAFGHNGDDKTFMSVKVMSISSNSEDSDNIDVVVKIQLNSLLVDTFTFKLLLDVVSKDFLCYFDKMGWTIERSVIGSHLWYQGDIKNEDLHAQLGIPDKIYEVIDDHNKIEYVLYRDSMNITLDDYEGLFDGFNYDLED